MSEHDQDITLTGDQPHDSDLECSQSVCSDSHSDNTTISEMTEKSAVNTLPASQSLDDTVSDLHNSSLDRKVHLPPPSRGLLLPWGVHKEYPPHTIIGNATSPEIHPGEYIMRALFSDFTVLAERKIDAVMDEPPHERPLAKTLQRGEDAQFDQLLSAFGSAAEHCLPSLLRALFAWYERQMAETAPHAHKKADPKKSIIHMVAGTSTETIERTELDIQKEKRDLAVEFIFCLVLIEVLKQLGFHPGHEDHVLYIENLAFKHFIYREGVQTNPNAGNIHIISDLYAEVIGALAQSRFMSVRTRFMHELKDLRAKEQSPHTIQSIISLLMGMKFFRVKMVPIEEFEASFQYMQECAQYFLDVKDKDVKHALAGLFVEILVPVAAAVKNEVNVPCLKNFVEMLYASTLDASTKSKHRLALFPLVTCLLCVSQKLFFLANWHYFLAMCLSHLKNRDPKMCRVALESLYRLLWVYMIRIKCESNSATQSRLQSIVNSLFPKGSKGVVPRDTPLNIFVKIIQFIAQERLDFAMREIVFDLLSVGRPIKIILTPERMSIGLRAFLVVADGLQQKEGEPPMPRSVGVLPSGNTLRVRKTFLNKMLTDDTARSIGISSYFPHVRRVFVDILRALDTQYGRPMMMTNTQNVNKEPDEMITGERKPRIDLFRTCVAAVPRLIPDGMTGAELVDLLSRLTVHMDEELRGLAFQSLQTLVIDFPDWRHDVVLGLTQFIAKDVLDTFPLLVDNGLKMVLTLICAWKSALVVGTSPNGTLSKKNDKVESIASVLHLVEALALVMLCNYRTTTRKLAVLILKEVKSLFKTINYASQPSVVDVIDRSVGRAVDKALPLLPAVEKVAVLSAGVTVDLQWLADRTTPPWLQDDANNTKVGQFQVVDAWSCCIFGFMERERIPAECPAVLANCWPIVFTRLNALYAMVDPTPLNDNRASLLRSSAALKKPTTERDAHMHLWKNYITFAFRCVPPISINLTIRCASPDLSLSSSPDSLTTDRSEPAALVRSAILSPCGLYKLVVPLLRCEVGDVRDAAVYAVGSINVDAFKDLMDELGVYLREAIDRKQENVRRRRRRDALRLQLVRALEYIAENQTLNVTSCILDKETQTLHAIIVEFVEGVCFQLENEPDKTSTYARDLTQHFAYFLRKLIKSFSLETCRTLLKRDLRRNLFTLFSHAAGRFGLNSTEIDLTVKVNDFELIALQAMSSLLTCGPYFDRIDIFDDNSLFAWLSQLLNNNDEIIYRLGQETIILLLESNPDVCSLLDWVVDKCYTGSYSVADGCFQALAVIFSAREYPCDHYTAIINVTLMNCGCARAHVRDTALQLLQLLDKRFFGDIGPLAESDLAEGDRGRGTLDALLAATYHRSQMHLSRQLALLHPELTMPIFSEITFRFQSARNDVKQLLLGYLLPWLFNMELVDPNLPSGLMHHHQFYERSHKEGWGSAEATEMVLNNIFYITTKFGDYYPNEIEQVWATLCTSWPNNMKVIIRYLIIISGMAPNELLPYAKRVVLYLARVQPVRLLDEMMLEMQTVETLNCLIERTETPPFYRLTVMRKTSSHSDGGCGGGGGGVGSVSGGVGGGVSLSVTNSVEAGGAGGGGGGRGELGIVEKGTIHTKRHSGEDPSKLIGKNSNCEDNDEDEPNALDALPSEETCHSPSDPHPQPHPLPMPAYGGHFAPLTEYLPSASLPISTFHRCNVGVMLLCDVVVDGIDLDWTVHVPLMLHIIFLGLDHNRPLVHHHCKQLLLNLLIVLAQHNDHLTVAHALLNAKTHQLQLGLSTPLLPTILKHNFTEPYQFEQLTESRDETTPPIILTPDVSRTEANVSILIKSLINYLSSQQNCLWNYEDITAKVWTIKSAEQIQVLLQNIVKIFQYSLPNAHINERWAQTALQLGLSCSSRHYAGRSLQIYRSLCVPITSRMLSDILSRLVETVAEQGEDMQGYVTELLLTLESSVDSLESNFRPLDLMKDFFKSTPNLNKDSLKLSDGGATPVITQPPIIAQFRGETSGHTRSTSYSVSYAFRKHLSPNEGRIERLTTKLDESKVKYNSNLSRSRSAQSLKLLGDSQANQDDKLTILAQLFWLAVSLLETDYEHEFLLAVRLLARLLHRLPLDRPDARDKVEKLQAQLRWPAFPGVHALLLKGCTHPTVYEPVVGLLCQLTPLLNLLVVDPSQSVAFPMNVIALLPYMLLNFEDGNEICIRAAENIAQASSEKSKKLENLGTVMSLYSRRTFSKESFQWTKCVIKYLYDTYAHLSFQMLTFLIEVLEKGPSNLQLPILNIIHCILHYVDLASSAAQPIRTDLLRVIVKYIEGGYWREALKILKLVVTRSSSLVAPPVAPSWEYSFGGTGVASTSSGTSSTITHLSFNEDSFFGRKELPGRTMEFSFDVSQTPVIGRRFFGAIRTDEQQVQQQQQQVRSLSDVATPQSVGWKRPWMSQGRVRECLVNLLTTCGQRVGLPKSPSVIFSQTSDLIERQSSMASSTEEVSGLLLDGGDLVKKMHDDPTDFGVFKDFDFLEYESESIEGESTDNFNWGVRRRPLDGEEEANGGGSIGCGGGKVGLDSVSERTPTLTVRKRLQEEVGVGGGGGASGGVGGGGGGGGESSDDEVGSESPLDEVGGGGGKEGERSGVKTEEAVGGVGGSERSDTSGSSDLGDVTPCNASPSLSGILTITAGKQQNDEVLENWSIFIQNNMIEIAANILDFYKHLQHLIMDTCNATIEVTKESCILMQQSSVSRLPTIKLIASRFTSMIDIINNRIVQPKHLIWFNTIEFNNTKFIEMLKYGMLEVQEHLETFCDKKNQALMYCNAVKTVLNSEGPNDQNSLEVHNYLLDLGKSLYKLYFQLLLLIESGNKMMNNLHSTLIGEKMKDLTDEIEAVQSYLEQVYEQTEDDESLESNDEVATIGSIDEFCTKLYRFILAEKYATAVSFYKLNIDEFREKLGECESGGNDVVCILNIYSRCVVNKQQHCFILTNHSYYLADIFGRLFQVNAAVSDLESVARITPQLDKSSEI